MKIPLYVLVLMFSLSAMAQPTESGSGIKIKHDSKSNETMSQAEQAPKASKKKKKHKKNKARMKGSAMIATPFGIHLGYILKGRVVRLAKSF